VAPLFLPPPLVYRRQNRLAALSRNRYMFAKTRFSLPLWSTTALSYHLSYYALEGNLGISKIRLLAFGTLSQTSELRKFRHVTSIVATCYRLSSTKVDSQRVINWTVVCWTILATVDVRLTSTQPCSTQPGKFSRTSVRHDIYHA